MSQRLVWWDCLSRDDISLNPPVPAQQPSSKATSGLRVAQGGFREALWKTKKPLESNTLLRRGLPGKNSDDRGAEGHQREHTESCVLQPAPAAVCAGWVRQQAPASACLEVDQMPHRVVSG